MFGEHEQSCKSHNRNLRHNHILDALISVARTVGISANRDRVLSYMRSSPDDACKKQPDGVFHMYLTSHLATLGDVTCCHPTTASALKTTYRSVGDVACGAEGRNVVKYGPEATRHQFHFVPLGCETYGAPVHIGWASLLLRGDRPPIGLDLNDSTSTSIGYTG
eukprot:SAG11_NODE_2358_length_3465_cov_17.170478_4_plen_164_part_00